MTQIQYGSAAEYDPEEYRKTFTNGDDLFDTLNIKEELPDQDREDAPKGEYKTIPKFPETNAKHGLRIKVVSDEHIYRQWLIDLYQYLYYHSADVAFTFDNIRNNEGLTHKQRKWLDLIQASCIQLSRMPVWLENELNDRYNPGEDLIVALAIMREKYHPENLIEEIKGFRVQRRYKIENVRRILQNFQERLKLAMLRELEPLMAKRVKSGIETTRDHNGKLHYLVSQNHGLPQIIQELGELADNKGKQSDGFENMSPRDTNKKVHKPLNRFGNKYNSDKNKTKKYNPKHQSDKTEDTKHKATVANLRH